MPGFNQTGPRGLGAMSGRRMGRCANNQRPLQTNAVEEAVETASVPTLQRGFGFGRGNGAGCQRRFRGNH